MAAQGICGDRGQHPCSQSLSPGGPVPAPQSLQVVSPALPTPSPPYPSQPFPPGLSHPTAPPMSSDKEQIPPLHPTPWAGREAASPSLEPLPEAWSPTWPEGHASPPQALHPNPPPYDPGPPSVWHGCLAGAPAVVCSSLPAAWGHQPSGLPHPPHLPPAGLGLGRGCVPWPRRSAGLSFCRP